MDIYILQPQHIDLTNGYAETKTRQIQKGKHCFADPSHSPPANKVNYYTGY